MQFYVSHKLKPIHAGNMRRFLIELTEGAHTANGTLKQQCLIPAVAVLAHELKLLDNASTFR